MITVCGLLLMSWVMKTITDMSVASLSIYLITPLIKYVLYAVFSQYSSQFIHFLPSFIVPLLPRFPKPIIMPGEHIVGFIC